MILPIPSFPISFTLPAFPSSLLLTVGWRRWSRRACRDYAQHQTSSRSTGHGIPIARPGPTQGWTNEGSGKKKEFRRERKREKERKRENGGSIGKIIKKQVKREGSGKYEKSSTNDLGSSLLLTFQQQFVPVPTGKFQDWS